MGCRVGLEFHSGLLNGFIGWAEVGIVRRAAAVAEIHPRWWSRSVHESWRKRCSRTRIDNEELRLDGLHPTRSLEAAAVDVELVGAVSSMRGRRRQGRLLLCWLRMKQYSAGLDGPLGRFLGCGPLAGFAFFSIHWLFFLSWFPFEVFLF
jgi:hypothetical protein